jgi:hypothetical protein
MHDHKKGGAMLTSKNPFATTPPVLSKKSPLRAAEDAEAGKRLLEGRTETYVTKLLGETEAARKTIADAREQFSECLATGVETTAAADALHRAEARLRDLESELPLATTKREQAITDRRQAKEQVERERLRELLIRLNQAGREVDACVASLKRVLAAVCPLMDETRALGFDRVNHKLNDAQTFFRQWVLDSCGVHMRGCKTGLSVFVKRGSWSETLPQPDQADHMRLTPYPVAMPIPNWQVGD